MMDTMTAFLQIVMAAVGTLGFALFFNIRGSKLVLAVIGGALSWAVNLVLSDVFASEPFRFFLCAALSALYSEILARKLKTPATTFFIPTLIPHIPGGALYRTMRFALDRQWMACLSQAFYTLKLALGLAMGLTAVLAVFNAYGVLHQYVQKRKEAETR